MQRSQIDFLNHGLLPFVGRSEEAERIARFWGETSDSPGLRAMIISGEAGIGKSRLIEEITPRIANAGGTVIQTKLYPDAGTSIAPLLARALTRSATAGHLLKSEPEETMGSVAAALLRISSLRPTLVIVEDLHLLPPDAVPDFAAILDRLADEPLSLLATARPVETPARAVLERYLVEEITLHGLSGTEIALLCRSIFGEQVREEIVQTLRERTTGNSLALRSALRGALRTGSPGAGPRNGSGVMIDQNAFVRALERNVRLLSEGMVTHLTEREREAAERLAMLGEVFARETAQEALAEAETMLEVLTFKGIITTSASPPLPITDTQSKSAPLAFTHSLLHRHFADRGRFDADMMVRILAARYPLYSLIPFPLLETRAHEVTAHPEEIALAIERIFTITAVLDRSSNWNRTATVMNVPDALAEQTADRWPEERRRELQALIIINHLTIQRRLRRGNYGELVQRLMALTENPRNSGWGLLRLRAIVYRRRQLKRVDPAACLKAWSEVESIANEFPELRNTRPYISHLRESAEAAKILNLPARLREVEALFRAFLDDPATTEAIRFQAWLTVTPFFLNIAESSVELAARLRELSELEAVAAREDTVLAICKQERLFQSGLFDRCIAFHEETLPVYRELGMQMEIFSSTIMRIFSEMVIGGTAALADDQIDALIEMIPEIARQQAKSIIGPHFAGAALLLGDWERARRYQMLFGKEAPLLADRQILLEVITADIDSLRETMERGAQEIAHFRAPLALLMDPAADLEPARQTVRTLLARELLMGDDLIHHRAMIELVDAIDLEHPGLRFGASVEQSVHDSVIAMLEWLNHRSLPAVMRVIVDRFEQILTKAEVRTWRAAVAALSRRREEERASSAVEQPLHVSLLGTITVQAAGQEEPARVRGTQLCTMLGLMAADHMLAKPLSANEFASIVFGSERDPDSVRKSMNFAVFRLRELLSPEAISTAGETPVLDLAHVDVDLIRAHRHLTTATEAMREGALVRALPELVAALAICGGRVPFPTLYDEFFEAVREDFESELRSTTIRLARALQREGDGAAAEEVLRLAFAAMPDDEEIAELLQDALVSLGKRTEARRIGMRAEMEGMS
ncbi:MAG: AAA family ATPase [Bacteroidetes bacterium]|nr:AAA family ATPase [Bacteroidota bacterium]